MCLLVSNRSISLPDVDECKNNAGMILGVCNNGRCVNTMGDYFCACSAGYRNGKNRKTCIGKNLSRFSFYFSAYLGLYIPSI